MALFFVGGCIRAGTTLLTNILANAADTHEQLSECRTLSRCLELYDKAENEEKHLHIRYFVDEADYRRFFEDIIKNFMSKANIKAKNAENIVLKDPFLTPNFKILAAIYPDARFFIPIRDPRDNITSIIKVIDKTLSQGRHNQLTEMSGNIEALCDFYMSFYNKIFETDEKLLEGKLYFSVHEQLVKNTKESIEKMENFSGLDISKYDPASGWNNEPRSFFEAVKEHKSAYLSELWEKPVSDQNIGYYKDTLSDSDIRTIENKCAYIFERFYR